MLPFDYREIIFFVNVMHDDFELEIRTILYANRSILKKNQSKGKTKIHAEQLTAEGFLFEYRTHEMRHQDSGERLAFIYEYGIGKLPGDYFEIIKLPLSEI